MARTRDIVAERLMSIQAAHGGELLPADVLEDARDPLSPLHDKFEWDDTKAAENFRQEQARVLIRSVQVVVHLDGVKIIAPAYIKNPERDQNDPGYVSTVSLRTDVERARRSLKDELARVESALERSRDVAALLDQTEPLLNILQRLREVQADIAAIP